MVKITKFDDGHHRRFWQAEYRGDVVQQYYPCQIFDPTRPEALERIRKERKECAHLVSELHAQKKQCAMIKDYESARIIGKLAKEYEGWVKASTWLLGWGGDGEFVHPKDWGSDLWPQLDGLIAMANVA